MTLTTQKNGGYKQHHDSIVIIKNYMILAQDTNNYNVYAISEGTEVIYSGLGQ